MYWKRNRNGELLTRNIPSERDVSIQSLYIPTIDKTLEIIRVARFQSRPSMSNAFASHASSSGNSRLGFLVRVFPPIFLGSATTGYYRPAGFHRICNRNCTKIEACIRGRKRRKRGHRRDLGSLTRRSSIRHALAADFSPPPPPLPIYSGWALIIQRRRRTARYSSASTENCCRVKL